MPWPLHELLRHKDVETTRDYTHVLNRGRRGVHSPLDQIGQASSMESQGRAGELCGPAGPHKIPDACRRMELKSLNFVGSCSRMHGRNRTT